LKRLYVLLTTDAPGSLYPLVERKSTFAEGKPPPRFEKGKNKSSLGNKKMSKASTRKKTKAISILKANAGIF